MRVVSFVTRPVRGMGPVLGLLAVSIPAWVLAGWLFLAEGKPAEASETVRGLHMRVLVPHETGWESIDLQMLLLDDGTAEWETMVEEARAGMLARFEGAIEATPHDITGQFVTLGWRWDNNMAEWHYNPADVPFGLEEVAEEIFTTAAETWTFAEDADFAYHYLGQTEADASMCDDGRRDGINVVTWADLPGSVLGVTCVPSANESAEYDMQFDFERPWSFDPEDVTIDLPSVATHEFGHALGLAHTRDREAVMFASYSRGSLKRVLQPDDVEGLKDVYGELQELPIFEEGDREQTYVPGLRRE